MSEQHLNDAVVDPAFQKVGRKRVPESVDSDRLRNPSSAADGRQAACTLRTLICSLGLGLETAAAPAVLASGTHAEYPAAAGKASRNDPSRPCRSRCGSTFALALPDAGYAIAKPRRAGDGNAAGLRVSEALMMPPIISFSSLEPFLEGDAGSRHAIVSGHDLERWRVRRFIMTSIIGGSSVALVWRRPILAHFADGERRFHAVVSRHFDASVSRQYERLAAMLRGH